MSGFQLRPGVIVDRDRGLAYVMSPKGGIVAVDLAEGTEAWSTMEAAKPLTLVGDLLVSQAALSDAGNDLEIVVLDAQERGRRVVAETVELPADVEVSIDERLESSFIADARAFAGEAAVSWKYSERLMQGIPPGDPAMPGQEAAPQDTAAEPEVTSGAFLLDLSSGAVSPPRPEETLVTFEPRALDLPIAARLAGVPGPQFLSADGRHVLSSEPIADDTVWDKYRWTIYDRGTGERVGEFRTYLPLAPFFVLDSEVVYETGPYVRQSETGLIEEPLKIRAVDLQTGQELWSQPVRDTTYRGPFPP